MKTKKKRRAEPQESNADILGDIREIMLLVLLMQACPLCCGVGRLPADPKDGKPTSVPCGCRIVALETLADFDVAIAREAVASEPEESEDSESDDA